VTLRGRRLGGSPSLDTTGREKEWFSGTKRHQIKHSEFLELLVGTEASAAKRLNVPPMIFRAGVCWPEGDDAEPLKK
jgi:hypothetical protein